MHRRSVTSITIADVAMVDLTVDAISEVDVSKVDFAAPRPPRAILADDLKPLVTVNVPNLPTADSLAPVDVRRGEVTHSLVSNVDSTDICNENAPINLAYVLTNPTPMPSLAVADVALDEAAHVVLPRETPRDEGQG